MRGYYLVQVGVIFWSKFGACKNGQLGPDKNPWFFAHNIFFKINVLFLALLDKQCYKKKTNLDQVITPEKAKLGPDNNSTAYLFMYVYMYMYVTSSQCTVKKSGVGIGSRLDPHQDLLSRSYSTTPAWPAPPALTRSESFLTWLGRHTGQIRICQEPQRPAYNAKPWQPIPPLIKGGGVSPR